MGRAVCPSPANTRPAGVVASTSHESCSEARELVRPLSAGRARAADGGHRVVLGQERRRGQDHVAGRQRAHTSPPATRTTSPPRRSCVARWLVAEKRSSTGWPSLARNRRIRSEHDGLSGQEVFYGPHFPHIHPPGRRDPERP